MAYEAGKQILNQLTLDLLRLVQSGLSARKDDGRIDGWEAMLLGGQAYALGTTILMLARTRKPEILAELEYVATQGTLTWTLPDEFPAAMPPFPPSAPQTTR